MAAEAVQYFKHVVPEVPDPAAVTEAYKEKNELAYLLSQVPLGTPREVKIIVCGAGLSGLGFAREVHVGNIKAASVAVYEKNSNIGGTWWENRYPG